MKVSKSPPVLKENPTYFLCGRKNIPELVKKAEAEAAQILKEFSMFYRTAGELSIEIAPIQYDYDWIITNPPFCFAKEFIERSVAKNKPFALLLKSQYWHSAKRHKIFTQYQPTFVLPLTWRPDFTGEGASLLDMIWCIWIGSSPVTYYLPLQKPKGDYHARNRRD